MQFPEKMQMGVNEIPVVVHDDYFKDGNGNYAVGMYRFIERDIHFYFDKDNPNSGVETFVHETIEAANKIGDLGLPHQTITTLAALLTQAYISGEVTFSMN